MAHAICHCRNKLVVEGSLSTQRKKQTASVACPTVTFQFITVSCYAGCKNKVIAGVRVARGYTNLVSSEDDVVVVLVHPPPTDRTRSSRALPDTWLGPMAWLSRTRKPVRPKLTRNLATVIIQRRRLTRCHLTNLSSEETFCTVRCDNYSLDIKSTSTTFKLEAMILARVAFPFY